MTCYGFQMCNSRVTNCWLIFASVIGSLKRSSLSAECLCNGLFVFLKKCLIAATQDRFQQEQIYFTFLCGTQTGGELSCWMNAGIVCWGTLTHKHAQRPPLFFPEGTVVFELNICKCVSQMWFGLVRFLWKGKWSPPKGLHNLWIGLVSCHRLWDCVDPKDKRVKGIVWHFGKYSYSLSCWRVLLHLSRLHLYKQMSFGMCVSSICVQIGAGTYASHIQQNTV